MNTSCPRQLRQLRESPAKLHPGEGRCSELERGFHRAMGWVLQEDSTVFSVCFQQQSIRRSVAKPGVLAGEVGEPAVPARAAVIVTDGPSGQRIGKGALKPAPPTSPV